MVPMMPVYIPVSTFMAPYVAPGGAYEPPEGSIPESAQEVTSTDSLPEQDALVQAYENEGSWFPYALGLWVRATHLKLLDEG